MRATHDSIELEQDDLCSIAAAGAAGVQLEHAIGSIDVPGLQETARQALLTDPAVLRAYRVGESRWKADLERELTLRIHDPKRGSMASNTLLLFTMRSRVGYKFAGQDDDTQSRAPIILVASNKLAKVQEAKAKAAAGVQDAVAGPKVTVKRDPWDVD